MSKTTNDPYLKYTGSDIITLQTSFNAHVSTNSKPPPLKDMVQHNRCPHMSTSS